MRLFTFLAVFLISFPVIAQELPSSQSSDISTVKTNTGSLKPVANDLFASGFSVDVDDAVLDDAHLVPLSISQIKLKVI